MEDVKVKDKYVLAKEYFIFLPEKIFQERLYDIWGAPYDHDAGCIFAYMNPEDAPYDPNKLCGCLTQIRNDAVRNHLPYEKRYVAWTEEMTKRIANDTRIPCDPRDITKENCAEIFDVLIEYQREADRTFRHEFTQTQAQAKE